MLRRIAKRVLGRPSNTFVVAANAARDAKQWTTAAAAYEKHLAKAPRDSGIWVQLGHCRKESGDLDGASAAYDRALALTPDDGDLHLQIGHLRKLQGRWDKARAAYRTALQKAPDLADAAMEISRLDMAHPEAARATAEQTSQGEGLNRNLSRLLEQGSTIRAISHQARTRDAEVEALKARLNALEERFERGDGASRRGFGVLDELRTKFERQEERLAGLLRQLSNLTQMLGTVRSLSHQVSVNAQATDALRSGLDAAGQEASAQRVAIDKVTRRAAEHEAAAAVDRSGREELSAGMKAFAARLASLEGDLTGVKTKLQALSSRAEGFDAVGRSAETAQWRSEEQAAQLGGLAERLQGIEQAFSQTRSALDQLSSTFILRNQQVDEVLYTASGERIAGVGARFDAFALQTTEMMRYLNSRVEFVRREILYEFNHGRHEPSRECIGSTLELAPQIKNPRKIAEARETGLRLNVGCGHIPVEGYINVDRRDLPGVDVIADADNLPFDPGSLAEIHSAHMIEHFPQETLVRRLIPHWKELLAPGGTLSAVVPDGAAMLAHHAVGDYKFDEFREVLFGAQDYDGDYHFNLLTPDSLSRILAEAGFQDIAIPVQGRRNGQCYEFSITARKAQP